MVAAGKLRRAQALQSPRRSPLCPEDGGRAFRRWRDETARITGSPAAGGQSPRSGVEDRAHHLRPRAGRGLQRQRHPAGPALHRREHGDVREDRKLLEALGRRRGRDFARRRQLAMRKDYPGIFDGLTFDRAERDRQGAHRPLRRRRRYLDQVYLLYNEFISAISQRVSLVQLLPIVPQKPKEGAPPASDYIYARPTEAAVLDALLPRHLARCSSGGRCWNRAGQRVRGPDGGAWTPPARTPAS